MTDDGSRDRIIEARMRLKQRFQAAMEKTPSVADDRPQGSGPANRHGMPQLPIGQTRTGKWPVLDLGKQPRIDPERWQLRIDGAVGSPVELSWFDFLALPQVTDTSDFHCVTTWSKLDIAWVGVQLSEVLALAEPLATATHLMCHAYDGYETNVALVEALKPDVLLAHTAGGKPLPIEHGGPCRMITPQLYAWKGAKWIHRIEVLVGDRPGFWERNGYSMTAHPWRNDRYG